MTYNNEIMDRVLEVAKEDGVISDDEFHIIKQVDVHSDTFYRILDKAKEDGVIDDNERDHLNSLREAIFERAKISANYDNKLSDDEKTLLTSLTKILKSIEY